MKNEILSVVFRVENPAKLAQWYEKIIGTTVRSLQERVWECHFKKGAKIKLIKANGSLPYKSDKSSVYWKIGLTMPNVDLAREKISNNSVTVSNPSQFLDIGYMCHLNDAEGFAIELLQWTFEKNLAPFPPIQDQVLGQNPLMGQITLRSSKIDESLGFYRDILGMKLLSKQKVELYGFTLYFLAFTDEEPPIADLESVENRQWLWQRQFTTIELQYKPGAKIVPLQDLNPGLDCIEIRSSKLKEEILIDPDGVKIKVIN